MNEQRDEALERFIAKSKQLEAQRKIDKQQWEACASYETPRNLVHLLFRGKGRTKRGVFCLSAIAIAMLMVIGYKLLGFSTDNLGTHVFFWVHMWVIWAVFTKRFHDLGQPGTWRVIISVGAPFVAIYYLIKLSLCKGDTGPNKFGI